MSRSSRKPTTKGHSAAIIATLPQFAKLHYPNPAPQVTKVWVSKTRVNKFEGMAETCTIVEPVFIPGYRTME